MTSFSITTVTHLCGGKHSRRGQERETGSPALSLQAVWRILAVLQRLGLFLSICFGETWFFSSFRNAAGELHHKASCTGCSQWLFSTVEAWVGPP